MRDPDKLGDRLPFCEAVPANVERMLRPEDWHAALAGVDAVVNCAGLLQASEARLEAVHNSGPAALFAACEDLGVRRVIHVSAVSAGPEVGTAYAASKWRGEEALRARDLDWVLLRPSLVWSPAGSYGGTSALRGLAALPLIPLIGRGDQAFTPITVADLARNVVDLLAPDAPARITLAPCGPETLTMRQILIDLRRWLGFGPARFLEIPICLMAVVCRLGDLFGKGPVTTTALRQLLHGNAADADAFAASAGFRLQTFAAALAGHPAQEQDRWHARLVFMEPALRLALVLLWLGSGIAGLLAAQAEVLAVTTPLGLPEDLGLPLGRGASLADLVIAVALAFSWRPRLLGWIQIGFILSYSAVLTLAQPLLWLAPLGPLLKNLPILAAVAVHMVLASRR